MTIVELLKINDSIQNYLSDHDLTEEDLNPMDWAPDSDTFWMALAAGDFQSHCYDANEGDGNFSREQLIEIVTQSFQK